MKVLKYVFLVIGLLGLIASIYNITQTDSFTKHTVRIFSAILRIAISMNLEKLTNGCKILKQKYIEF